MVEVFVWFFLQFFLFNDVLVYGNIVINKKKVCEFDQT